ncbi:MAG: helix-turn-helix domain-containing protein [Sedimenticolaceae bacterium]
MRQTEGINQTRKDKLLNWEERIQIETLQRVGLSTAQIGMRLGRPARTIQREIRRGWVLHRTGKYTVQERYSADRGQTIYEG